MKLVTRFANGKNDLRWIVLLVLLFLIIVLAWPDPASGASLFQSETPTPYATLTATNIPLEYLSTPDQTSGIICGSVVLVLIIVGGTVGVLRRKNGAPRK